MKYSASYWEPSWKLVESPQFKAMIDTEKHCIGWLHMQIIELHIAPQPYLAFSLFAPFTVAVVKLSPTLCVTRKVYYVWALSDGMAVLPLTVVAAMPASVFEVT